MQGECGFFEWKDEKFTSWSVEVINGLRAELMRMKNKLLDCRSFGCERCRGKINLLEREIEKLGKMIVDANSEVANMKMKIRILCILLGVALMFISYVIIANA